MSNVVCLWGFFPPWNSGQVSFSYTWLSHSISHSYFQENFLAVLQKSWLSVTVLKSIAIGAELPGDIALETTVSCLTGWGQLGEKAQLDCTSLLTITHADKTSSALWGKSSPCTGWRERTRPWPPLNLAYSTDGSSLLWDNNSLLLPAYTVCLVALLVEIPLKFIPLQRGCSGAL